MRVTLKGLEVGDGKRRGTEVMLHWACALRVGQGRGHTSEPLLERVAAGSL